MSRRNTAKPFLTASSASLTSFKMLKEVYPQPQIKKLLPIKLSTKGYS